MTLPNNTFHRSSAKAWLVWTGLMLFVGIFIFRPVFGLFLGLGIWLTANAVLFPLFTSLSHSLAGKESDDFNEEPEGYVELADENTSFPNSIQHEMDLQKVHHLASQHQRQENPVNGLPKVVLAMVLCVGMLILMALLGSTLITFGLIGIIILLIFATVGIWGRDVTEWQHEEGDRINPGMSENDIEESLRDDGLQETFRKTHHWNE